MFLFVTHQNAALGSTINNWSVSAFNYKIVSIDLPFCLLTQTAQREGSGSLTYIFAGQILVMSILESSRSNITNINYQKITPYCSFCSSIVRSRPLFSVEVIFFLLFITCYQLTFKWQKVLICTVHFTKNGTKPQRSTFCLDKFLWSIFCKMDHANEWFLLYYKLATLIHIILMKTIL